MENTAVSDNQLLTTRIELQLRLPLLWLALLLVATFTLPDRVWNAFLVGIGGLFVVAYLWAKALASGLYASRQLRFSWVAVGDQLEEQFLIQNNSNVPALWVEVRDHSTVPGYWPAIVRSVGTHSVDKWRQTAVCQRRGQFRIGPWTVRAGDPFGIFGVVQHYPETTEIIIHPPIHDQLPLRLPAGQSSGRTKVRQRAWRATLNAATVREYRPNDPYRLIHWPTSARRNDLFVREFDLDASGDIWLLPDLQAEVQLGQEDESTEEHAVLLAASLAAQALHHQRAVGLASYGRIPYVATPSRGQGQQWQLLRLLALVQASGEVSLTHALQDLSRIAQRGATAVIITADYTGEWLPSLLTLAQRGIRSNVILLDRPSFGGVGHSERVCEMVQQLGFNCEIVQQGHIGQPITPSEQHRWEFRVTPLGKVVAINQPKAVG